jgi:hypothetical protein
VAFFFIYVVANARRAIAEARETEDVWAYLKHPENVLMLLHLLLFVLIFALMGAILANTSRARLLVTDTAIMSGSNSSLNFSVAPRPPRLTYPHPYRPSPLPL